MKELDSFKIPFVGLKQGKHSFLYKINESFFSHFEGAIIDKCQVSVDLTFEKKERLFVLDFEIKGTVTLPCDRCLEPVDVPVKGSYRMYVKFEDADTKRSEDEEDVMYIFSSETHLDISRLIYDYVNLCLPMKVAHEEGKCEPGIIEILKQKTAIQQEADPRWEALKSLKKPREKKPKKT